MTDTHLDDPASVERALTHPWGTVTTGGVVTQRICPLCCALIPAHYSNAHETTVTPMVRHADTHRATAVLFARANRKAHT